ncbi:ribosomal-processing cysteine protease Prp [Pseudoramibacter porci]|uniref:Ribosomal processing cysteine protease Prp n=1 Tax=Pseudoramibacter porci TaxID=2606631 RepID=A0A7X2TAK0_9FIRM|nr:ribosomal-processing cysteine protease Prp [Pseudoramibacter porci]MSS19868.1 ribosomal-processing cysteine protease Prp [Pseudoramibacter porci]
MIQVRITYRDETITHIDVTGHSGYEDSGKDIVCAGVSVLTIALINGMIEVLNFPENEVVEKYEPGETRICVPQLTAVDEMERKGKLLVLLQTYLINIRLITETYSDFVNIIEVDETC